jgi:hypothetical protein
MKPRTISCGCSILLLLVATAVPGFAAPFSAEVTDTSFGQTTTGTFHYQDKNCRLDLGDKDGQLLAIFDGQTGVTRLFSPPEKTYVEARPDDPMSLANPFSAYAQFAKTKTVRTEGAEFVGGVRCKKQVVFNGEEVFITGWVSDEFDVPLKVQIPALKQTIELKNIKRGPQDPALFATPAGYRLRVEEPARQPEWVGQVAGAPVLAVPFEKTLAEGGIVRLHPQAGRWLKIEGANAGKGEGSFTSAHFKGGKSLGPGEMFANIVNPGASGAIIDGTQPDGADEIIIRVGKGTLTIKTSFVAPQPR